MVGDRRFADGAGQGDVGRGRERRADVQNCGSQIVKAFGAGQWDTVEMIDDPFANALVADVAVGAARSAA